MRTRFCSLITAVSIFFFSAVSHAQQGDAKTLRTWKAKCASCHGGDGKGQTEEAKKLGGLRDLSSAEVQGKLTDDKIKEIIVKGVKEKKGDKEAEMPALKDASDESLAALVKLVRSLKK